MDDYEQNYDLVCPKCNHSPLHQRDCNGGCNDGYHDESEEDPINYMPGESYILCHDCWGYGVETWCPSCGADVSKIWYIEAQKRFKNSKLK